MKEADLARLYHKHARALRQRARSLLGSETDAEDVLQEVFLAMLARPDLHRGEASVFTLLYQMVTHKALDQYRARIRRQSLLARQGAGREREETEGLARVDALGELRRMARVEAPQVLSAAVLHFVAGHTQEEVARVLGVSRKTVVRMLGGLTTRARCPRPPRRPAPEATRGCGSTGRTGALLGVAGGSRAGGEGR